MGGGHVHLKLDKNSRNGISECPVQQDRGNGGCAVGAVGGSAGNAAIITVTGVVVRGVTSGGANAPANRRRFNYISTSMYSSVILGASINGFHVHVTPCSVVTVEILVYVVYVEPKMIWACRWWTTTIAPRNLSIAVSRRALVPQTDICWRTPWRCSQQKLRHHGANTLHTGKGVHCCSDRPTDPCISQILHRRLVLWSATPPPASPYW